MYGTVRTVVWEDGRGDSPSYPIESGYVEISTVRADGKNVVACLGPGEIFGEMAPIEKQCRTGTATALHVTTVVPIARAELDAEVQNASPLVQMLLRSALNRLRDTRAQVVGAEARDQSALSTHSAKSYQAVRRRAAEHIQRRRELQEAVEGAQFALAYQPIVNLADGRTAGYEALIRWPNPQGGMVSPAEFIPLAEESGLIVPLGLWVLETALDGLRRMQKHAEQHHVRNAPLFISVNVSPRQIETRSDLEQLARTIENAKVDTSTVKLEITEGMLLADPVAAAAGLARLKTTGAKVALDDFGVGYSSLSYLHRYPIDTLKIDRSFVSGLTREKGVRQVVSGILLLAQALDMDVVAEGIEELDEYLWLQERGCRYGQGFLMGKPVPFTDATKHITRSFEW